MMNNSSIITIENFFSDDEYLRLDEILKKGSWILSGYSQEKDQEIQRKFWYKSLLMIPDAIDLFKNKIEKGIQQKITINTLYVNGQAHGQCGHWHQDAKSNNGELVPNYFTLLFFPNHWFPEYGGHLLLKTDKITSILPEYNKAVLFNSGLFHVGLEPTVHCLTQRESIACKFTIFN